ncbi:helix-turn-helix domain-containing protein [Enterococcus termitis]
MSFEDFCEEHYISNSTMIRRINSCRIVFQRFNIRFSFSKFQFIGREDNIRNFIYNTLWMGTQGIFYF